MTETPKNYVTANNSFECPVSDLRRQIDLLGSRLAQETKLRLEAETRLVGYGRDCRCSGCAKSEQAECPRRSDSCTIDKLREQMKGRLRLIQKAAQDEKLSDGALRCAAANISHPGYPHQPPESAVKWAEGVVQEYLAERKTKDRASK
jgi:hypothetical protein